METSSLTRTYTAVFIVALLVSICFQGSRGLYDRDETRYSECAREMLITGSWLIPLRDFKPHLTKPPLTYWAIGVSLKTFGINEWGARIPNAVAFSVTVLLVGLIGAGLFGERYGPWSSVIYLTSIVPFAASNIVTTDTILVMWEVAAVWAFLKAFQAETKARTRMWFAIMALFWGLGFLTKGPAIFPVAAPLGLFWLFKRRHFRVFPAGFAVIFIFLVTGLSWYVIVWKQYPWAMDLIIKEQVTGRLFYDMFHRNSAWYAPFYIYLPMVLFGCLPWAFGWIGIVRRYLGHRTLRAALNQAKNAISREPEWLFIFLWWLVPLLIFCVAKSRLPLYILPVFPPMAIATARLLFKEAPPVLVFTKKVLVTLVFFLTLKGIAALIPAPQDARAMYREFSSHIKDSNDIDAIGEPFLDGLAFYSGKPFEYLPTKPSGASSHPTDSQWDEEIREIKEGKSEIFVLDVKKKSRLELIKHLGLDAKLLKRFHRYGVFKVYTKEG